MSRRSILSIGPAELAAAALSSPLVSLILAMVICGGILIVARERGDRQLTNPVARPIAARYAPEHRTLGLAAIAVIALFAAENVIRGYLLDHHDQVSWWRYATPVFGAALGIAVTLSLIVLRGTTPPEVPVLAGTRRTWTSFSSRTGIACASIVFLALVATTLAAGAASSADGEGRYIWLEIPVPNEARIDPIRPWFYGWAYGIPVLICLTALIAVTWGTLHRNAARPYRRPDTIAAEGAARREVALGTVRIATAGMLLALAGAWRFIAGAGSSSSLVVEGQNEGNPYDVVWRYAELATAAGWCAPAIEIIAFVLLLLVASGLRREPSASSLAQSGRTVAAGDER